MNQWRALMSALMSDLNLQRSTSKSFQTIYESMESTNVGFKPTKKLLLEALNVIRLDSYRREVRWFPIPPYRNIPAIVRRIWIGLITALSKGSKPSKNILLKVL